MVFQAATIIFTLWILCHVHSKRIGKEDCDPRWFGYNSFVCVCNSTHCDTIEELPQHISKDECIVYTTSKNEFRLWKTTLTFESTDRKSFESYGKDNCQKWHAGVAICVDTQQTKQTITGFGGSFTDSTGVNMENLSEPTRRRLMESYFGTKGLQYSIGRVPIGGCDFSTRPYTLDESINDFELQNFKLAEEDFKYKITTIHEAQQMSQHSIKLVASSWSAPTWMKLNNKINGFLSILKGHRGGKYYQAYADYYVRFMQEYHKLDIDFWAITAQNEPIDGFVPFFPFNNMGFLPQMQRIFVNENLGPALEKAGFSRVKVFVLDDNRPFIIPFMHSIMKDDRSSQYVSGAALHWYMDNLISPSVLDWVHDRYPDKELLMTEASFLHLPGSGEPVQLGNWNRARDYASTMIENFNHWVTGWIDWNLALDPDGGPNWANFNLEGTIIVNKNTDEFYKQPVYYILGHFAKFVPPESKVIEISLSRMAHTKGISAVAFVTPASKSVLVVLNRNSYDINVNMFITNVGHLKTIIYGNAVQTYISVL